MSPPGVLRVIVGAELRALWNRLRTGNRVRLVALALVLVIGTPVIGAGAFAAGATVGHFLTFAVDPLLAAAFTGLSLLMLVIGFPTVIASFFVGRDLLQLVVAPVRPRDIFITRLAIAISANLLIGAILVAGVLGVGAGAGAPWVYYIAAAVLITLQVVIVTVVQVIFMTVILRWVPARIARDAAAGVAGLTGAALYLAWNLNLRQTFGRRGARPDLSNLTSLGQRIDWLPTTWPGHALSALIEGSFGSAVVWVLATLLLAAVLLFAATFLYERTLLSGLGTFGGSAMAWRRKTSPSSRSSPLRGVGGVGVGSPTLAIARKDWLGFRRDVRRLTRLLPALLLPLGYAAFLSQPSTNLNGFWSNVSLLAILSMFMCGALAFPSIPAERRGFQLLRLAPFTMWQLIKAKIFIALPPVVVTMIVFSVAVAVASKSDPAQVAQLVILGLWLAAGFVSISVAGGAIDPRFDATDDRKAVGLVGTVAGVGGSLAFALMSVGALALILFGQQAVAGTANLGPIPATPAVGASMVFGGVLLVGAGCVLVAGVLWIANARLRAFEANIAST
jgi:hypothetical protein